MGECEGCGQQPAVVMVTFVVVPDGAAPAPFKACLECANFAVERADAVITEPQGA